MKLSLEWFVCITVGFNLFVLVLFFYLLVNLADTAFKYLPDENACQQYDKQQDDQCVHRKGRFGTRHGISACFHKYGGRDKGFPSFIRDQLVTGTGQDCDRVKTLYQ